ncbi:hypothetical protein FACS1894186_1490 [Alphaproteobacteria bacterium]|nr:hypothetical protein FACS1894186_1490 [Alphaproteobacteria bacterium]
MFGVSMSTEKVKSNRKKMMKISLASDGFDMDVIRAQAEQDLDWYSVLLGLLDKQTFLKAA